MHSKTVFKRSEGLPWLEVLLNDIGQRLVQIATSAKTPCVPCHLILHAGLYLLHYVYFLISLQVLWLHLLMGKMIPWTTNYHINFSYYHNREETTQIHLNT